MSREIVGQIAILLGVDDAEAQKGFKRAWATAKSFGSAVATTAKTASLALGAVGVAAGVVGVSLDQAADEVDRLGKMAKRLQLPVEQLSAMRFAAKESGIEVEQLGKLAQRAAVEVAKMVDEGKTTARIGKMTVGFTDAGGRIKDVGTLVQDLARGIQSADGAASKLQLAQKFFGREGGGEFVTLLAEAGDYMENLSEQTQRAQRLGVIFTEDQVQKLTAYRDAVGRVGEAWTGLKVQLATEFAPELTEFLDGFAERVAKLPQILRGLMSGLSSDASAVESQRAQELVESMVYVLLIGAREAAYSFSVIVGRGLVGAAEAAANRLARALLSEEDTKTGSNAALEEAIRQRDELQHLVAVMRAGGRSVTTSDGKLKLIGPAVGDAVRGQLGGRLGSIDEALRVAETRVAQQRGMLAANTSYSRDQITKSIAASTGSSLDYFGSLKADVPSELRDSLSRFRESISRLTKAADAIVPPGSEAATTPFAGANRFGPFPQSREQMLAGIGNPGGGGGMGIGLAMSSLYQMAAAEHAIAEQQLQKLGEKAKDILIDIFPEEKLADQIAGIRKLQADLAALGDTTTLTEEKVQEAVARLTEEFNERRRRELNKGKEDIITLGEAMKDTIEKSFSRDASRAFVDFVAEGKGSFKDLATSWAKTLAEMAVQAMIFRPLMQSLGAGLFGERGVFTGTDFANTTYDTKSAKGNVFSRGTLVPFADGGVVGGPTMFPMSGGRRGLMGEAGPEAIMPLARDGAGRLGVRAGGSSTVVNIIDQRRGGEPVSVSQSTGPDGRQVLEVIVRDSVRELMRSGTFDSDMRANYGLGRTGRR